MAEVAKEGSIFDFFTGVNELSLQIIPIPVNCSSSGEVGTESPFSRSLQHWPIQQAAMANTAGCIGHRSLLCEKGGFFSLKHRYNNMLQEFLKHRYPQRG